MRENIRAAQKAGRNDVLTRYKKIAQIVTGRTNVHVEDGVLWVKSKRPMIPRGVSV